MERELTNMFSKRTLIAVGLFMVVTAGAVSFGRDPRHKDDNLYDKLVTIKGKAQILNHPELGKTEGVGIPLLFQRDGCHECLIATRTDTDGGYEITVSRGRYRVIVRETRGGGAPSYDLLAPDQPRYINATSRVQANEFDLRIVLPSR